MEDDLDHFEKAADVRKRKKIEPSEFFFHWKWLIEILHHIVTFHQIVNTQINGQYISYLYVFTMWLSYDFNDGISLQMINLQIVTIYIVCDVHGRLYTVMCYFTINMLANLETITNLLFSIKH